MADSSLALDYVQFPNGEDWKMSEVIDHAFKTLMWTGYTTTSEDELIELDSDEELALEIEEAGMSDDDAFKISQAIALMMDELSEDELLKVYELMMPGQFAHDFILTAQHQGAGFWDRGYGDIGDKLTELAQSFGEEASLTAWWETSKNGERVARYAIE